MINVERTCGGGGNKSEKRKAKLKELRAQQGTALDKEIRAMVKEVVEARANPAVATASYTGCCRCWRGVWTRPVEFE